MAGGVEKDPEGRPGLVGGLDRAQFQSSCLGGVQIVHDEVQVELLRPLLKQWLDDNLPGIVETAVREEVERIARGRVR